MVMIMDNESGEIEFVAAGYGDEVLLAGWTDVPRLPADEDGATRGLQLGLAEVESSPLADPDFIARMYRSQR